MHEDTKSVVRFVVRFVVGTCAAVGALVWALSMAFNPEPEPTKVTEELIENSGGIWFGEETAEHNLFRSPEVLSLEETCEAIRLLPARDAKAFEEWLQDDTQKELMTIISCMYGRLF